MLSNRQQARKAYGQKLLPSLVFVRQDEQVWIVRNVGEGTAINIVIYNYADKTLLDKVELYPILPKEAIQLDYLTGASELVATYENIFGEDPHHTTCVADQNEFNAGQYITNAP